MPLSKSTIRQQRLRLENIETLGGRCANPDCRWHNDDGTIGCNDVRALQFDHKDGGGEMMAKKLKKIRFGSRAFEPTQNAVDAFKIGYEAGYEEAAGLGTRFGNS